MQITSNTTSFLAERFVATDKQARKCCVVVVKATFDVTPDGTCRPGYEQAPFVYVDVHEGDPGATAVRCESDFVPVKPYADVLVDASAVAPRGQPLTELHVALLGPGLAKPALVNGDRVWTKGLGRMTASRPRPFVTMELGWGRAFGGTDLSHDQTDRRGSELRNLAGVGFHLNADPRTIAGKPLPNVERPDQRMRTWSDKPQPMGFGPVGRGWQPRCGFAGTYDQKWMDEKLPFLPDDFDERYFQSAPLDQQLGELCAGMVFECRHMSPSGRFVARLPAMEVPVRFYFDDRIETRVARPDTLVLQPAAGRLVMTGRAGVPLGRKLSALREIQVGPPRYAAPSGKRHYPGLAAAVQALHASR